MINKEKPQDIHERIYQFVLRVLNLTKSLPSTRQNLILIDQITRSSTSMGANDQEADGTDSKKDFISKYSIVRKEGKETNYWLRLISNALPNLKEDVNKLWTEAKELNLIFNAIVHSSKKNLDIN